MLKLIEAIWAGKVQTQELNTLGAERWRGEMAYDRKKCSDCNKCVEQCPVGALRFNAKGKLSIDYNRCLFCGQCVEACSEQALAHSNQEALPVLAAEYGRDIGRVIHAQWGRSLHIRHLDAGSCNACDFELGALSNPLYDLHRFGLAFVASPRHADLLMVVTRNLEQAVQLTYAAMPEPKLVMAVGACAAGGATFGQTYATIGAVSKLLPVDIAVPGCPPRPSALLVALVAAADLYRDKVRHKL
ncbi:MAG: 4Fe-4S binding protein [Acidaminococcaceae bacterium]